MAGDNTTMTVFINANIKNFAKNMGTVEKRMKSIFGPEAMKLSKTFATAIAAAGAAVLAFGVACVAMADQEKELERTFTSLIGNVEDAKKLVEDLSDWATNVPFEFKDMEGTSKALLAYGVAAQDLIPVLNNLGNAAAMTGSGQAGIEAMTDGIGRIAMSGKVTAKEMKLLTNEQVNAYKYLADYMNTDVQSAMEQVKAGAVDSTTAINAIMTGMQKDFAGGMDNIEKSLSGMLGTMKYNLTYAMKSIGGELMDSLGITNAFEKMTEAVRKFAVAIKQYGLRETLENFIPPWLVALVITLAAAVGGIAVAAFIAIASSALAAIVPMLPFVAAATLVAAAAYLLYAAWDPIADLFSNTWDYIVSKCTEACNTVLSTLYDFALKALNYLQPVFDLFGMGEASTNWSNSVSERLQVVTKEMETTKKEAEKAADGISTSLSDIYEKLAGTGKSIFDVEDISVDTKWKGWHGKSAGVEAPEEDAGSGGAAKIEKSALQIEMEWEETKNRIKDKATDIATDIQNRFNSLNLQGVRKELFSLTTDEKKSLTEMEQAYRDMAILYSKATEEEQEVMRKEWTASGLLFDETENAKVSFAREMSKERILIEAETQKKIMDLNFERKAYIEDLDKAKEEGDIERVKFLLATEEAVNQLRRENAETFAGDYIKIWKDANATFEEMCRNSISDVNSGFESFFSNILSGEETLQESFASILKSFISMVTKMIAKWAAAKLTEKIFGSLNNSGDSGSNLFSTGASLVSNVISVKGYAGGGVGNGLSLVGENGPELIRLNNPSRVFNASESSQMLSGGNAVNMYVSTPDAGSFKQSRAQISASIYSALQRGGR